MTTKTPAKLPHSSQTDELSATDIFPLLADDRRREILHYLTQHTSTVSLGELAEQLAIWDGKPTYDHYERILTDLHHSQLPKLVDGGLVRYDVEAETVKALDSIESVQPYLELALVDDLE